MDQVWDELNRGWEQNNTTKKLNKVLKQISYIQKMPGDVEENHPMIKNIPSTVGQAIILVLHTKEHQQRTNDPQKAALDHLHGSVAENSEL